MKPVAVTLRIYRMLAKAFPSEFRNVYGDDLLQLAEDAVEPIWRRHGFTGLLRLLLDIAIQVPLEYLAEMRRDLTIGLRMLAASPGFTAVALTSLSLGICIATCAYSEVNGLLREIPGVPQPHLLITLQKPVSFPTYTRFHELSDLFSNSAAYVAPVPLAVSTGATPERIWGQLVTPSYFQTLGVRPVLGRFFDTSYDKPGQPRAAVISNRFWETHLGSDPAVIGRTIRVNGQPCLIIGVGRDGFFGASPTLFPADIWLPVTIDAQVAPELGNNALDQHNLAMFQMLGRLRPGINESSAQAELNTVTEQLAEFRVEPKRDRNDQRIAVMGGGRMIPLRKQDVPFFRQFLLVLGGLLLVIACANVANMMLARAADRRREIAVRLAMGASRARLIRQLLTESFLLAGGAAPPAILLCYWVMHLFSTLKMPLPIPIAIDLAPDWHALIFVFALTAIAALAFGLVPALQATRTDLVSALKEGGEVRLQSRRTFSLRNVLMFSQMAASLMLLLITGYLGLGIQSTLGLQEGFNPKNLYLVSVDPVRDGFTAERSVEFFEQLLHRLTLSPAISAVCITDTLPASIDGNAGVNFMNVTNKTGGSRDANWARKHTVGLRYFETAGIKILSGREFDRSDEVDGSTAVIVSREAVNRFWNGENPVGRRIELGNGSVTGGIGLWPGTIDYRSNMMSKVVRTLEVIGVAADVSEDLVASKKHAAVYFPLRPSDYAQPSLRGVTLMVRAIPGVDVIGVVRHEIAAIDSNVNSFNARSMGEHLAQFMSMLKAASWTYGVMGLFGLILASVGLAGVTAYSVAKRGREIGIRLALGAQKCDILCLVMKEGVLLVVLGTVAGLALALAGIRALSVIFFTVASVRGNDPMLLVGAPLLLASLALLACYIPARLATRIDPAVSLRME